jgi:hypothetical protein
VSVDSFVARMRIRQEALFETTVDVTRGSTVGTLDTATSLYTAGTSTTVYSGPALIRPTIDQITQAGDTSVELSDFLVKFPANTAIQLGDLVTVTASVHDSDLVGAHLRVIHIDNDEWQISRRVQCVIETGRPA